MTKTEIKKCIVEIYNAKGLNSVYSFLNKNGIKFEKQIEVFGLHTNKQAVDSKQKWVNHNKLQFHYYNRGISSRRNGYSFSYNEIRGIKIVLL